MKIVITSSFFHPHIGGLERNNWQIAKRLALTNEVFLITCNTENVERYENLDGINVVRLDSWNLAGNFYPIPKPTSKNLQDMKNLFGSSDVIISNTRFYILTLLSAIAGKWYKTRHIHIERGANHTVHPSRLIELVAKAYDLTLGRLSLWLADSIGGQSQAALDFVKSLGVKNKPMFVAYNGIDLEHFTNTQYNFEKILFVGRLIADKGCQDLIRAFKDIEKEFPRAELIIAGDGPARASLESLAKGSKVKFLGHVEYPEITKIYQECGIYVSLSYSNGLSTTILEAGAAGLIVLATDLSGVRELINNERGYLFEPGNTIDLTTNLRQILTEKPVQKGVNLQRYVRENFDWNNLVSKLEKQLIQNQEIKN